MLVLFYFLNLYRPEDRCCLAVRMLKANHIYEGVFFHSLQREPDGSDVMLNVSFVKNGAPNFSLPLSDIALIQAFYYKGVPDYVMSRLKKSAAPKRRSRQAKLRTDQAMATRDNYLRHPESGEGVFPRSYELFFQIAKRYAKLPEPFTVHEGARVVLGKVKTPSRSRGSERAAQKSVEA